MASPTMKSVVIDRFVSNFDELKVSEVKRPVPKDDEILVEVKAAGVNFVDTLYARGKHQNNKFLHRPPFPLGLECAGVVVSAPSSPKLPAHLKPGSRVFLQGLGCYSQYILVPLKHANSAVFPMPASWSFTAAAGLAATLPVSYGALVLAGGLTPVLSVADKPKTVLVHAAAGGLGLAAVQIAAALGHRVIGTAGSEAKCRVAERFGAEVCINYSFGPGQKWWERALELTDGKGVDIVYDSVGLVELSIKCLAHRGTVLVVGFAGRDADAKEEGKGLESVKMNRILLKQAKVIGYRFGESDRRYPEEKGQIWKHLWQLIEKGKITPNVYDEAYLGLESVPRALKDISSRKVWGKAVIQITNDAAEPPSAGQKSKALL